MCEGEDVTTSTTATSIQTVTRKPYGSWISHLLFEGISLGDILPEKQQQAQ